MSWVAPYTAVSGAIITAASVNQTRDNLIELRATPQYRCAAYHDTTQVITSGNQAYLSMNSESYDAAAMHHLVTDNYKVTIPASGTYMAFGRTHVDGGSASPNARLHLRNGTGDLVVSRVVCDPSDTLAMVPLTCEVILPMTAGDFFALQGAAETAAVTFGASTTGFWTWLQVIGPLPPA